MTPPLDRRQLLAGAAAALGAASMPALAHANEPTPRPAPPAPTPRPTRQPVLYLSHRSPMLALDARAGAKFTTWAGEMARPKALLVVSAHYEKAPATLTSSRRLPLYYDFRGFPRALYEVRWPAPGAPRLASRVQALLRDKGGVRQDDRRGLDHGTWVPLKWMHPQADVPTIQLSIPTHDPRRLWQLGRTLRPLRDEGVRVVASGSLTHNLRHRRRRGARGVERWAKDFEAWCQDVLRRRDVDQLLQWERKAPAARKNHPTVEHFVPLLLADGLRHDADALRSPIHGFAAGHLSHRCFQLG